MIKMIFIFLATLMSTSLFTPTKASAYSGTCSPGSPNCCLINNGQIGYPGLHYSTCAQGYTCVNHGSYYSCDSTARSRDTSTPKPTPKASSLCKQTCKTTRECKLTKNCKGTSMTNQKNCNKSGPSAYWCETKTCTTLCPTIPPSPIPSPSPLPIAACHNVIIYGKDFKSLDTVELASFKSGDQIYFCALGAGNAGEFTKARFTINAVVRPEITFQKPNSSYFCDLYTIPANVYDFAATAEVYNTVLGWK